MNNQSLEINDLFKEKVYKYAVDYKNRNLEKRGIVVGEPVEKIYVIYARRSTHRAKDREKDKQERSIKDQLDACKEYALKNNLKIHGIETEEETGYKPGKRDVFYKILENISEGKLYNSILAWHPDRLARNMKDSGTIMDMLDDDIIKDLKFPSYTFVNDPSGKMALGIQFVLAKNYSDTLGVNTGRGNDRKTQEGKYMGKSKHGYIADKDFFRPDPVTFPIIRKAWELVLDGTPYKKVHEFLIDQGYKKIGHSTLPRIFANPFYAGYHVHGDNVIDLMELDKDFTPMVTFKEFLQVRELLKGKVAFDKDRDIENVLFKKMVKCGYCGNNLNPGRSRSEHGNYYYYLKCVNDQCITVTSKNKLDKKNRSFRGKVVIDYVLNLIRQNVHVSRDVYEYMVKDNQKIKIEMIESLNRSIKTLKNENSELNDIMEGLAINLRSSKSKSIETVNEQITAKGDKIADNKEKISKLESQLIRIELGINDEVPSYEDFVNFFEKLEQTIISNTDLYLLDYLLRELFVNFSSKGRKIIAHELNEPFATFEKLGVFHLG